MREIRVLLWYAWRRKLVFVLANANFLWYDYTTLQPVSPVSKGRSADKFHDKQLKTVRWTVRIAEICMVV